MHRTLRGSIPLSLSLTLSACSAGTLLPPDHRLPDGSTHSGETREGLFHGEGVQRFPDGMVYKGKFRNGYWHGQGELSRDDWRYEGEFRQGRMSGEGVLTRENSRYEGQFRNGDFHGEGRFESDHQGIIQGTFADDEPVRATQQINGGEYHGEFRDWQWHGEGRWKDADGGVFKGTFKEGRLTGTGEYTGPNGAHYKGGFSNFQLHGEGVLTRADGTRIEATFRHGQPVGEGTLYRPVDEGESREIPGRWKNGEFIPEGEKSTRKKRQAVNERILARNAQRLHKQLNELAPSRPDEPDLYFLGAGGDGSASVFRRDLQVVHRTLDASFDIQDRSVRLLNDHKYRQFPLATRTSIRKALNRLDEIMHSKQDLLFVHLTSHGGKNGAIKLHQPGLEVPNLAPSQFKQWFENLDIRYKAVVVSACFSGHWVDALEGPNTLVMTASRGDRPAMGCGEQSEMTWFTRALYDEPDTFSLKAPQALFQKAQEQIRQWEQENEVPEDQTAHPQFHLGDAIRTYLQRSF